MNGFAELHDHLDLVREDLNHERRGLIQAYGDVNVSRLELDALVALNSQIAGVLEVLRHLIPREP